MKRKTKIIIFIMCLLFGFIAYRTMTHKTEITKFIVKTILEHKKENAFEFVNKFVSVVPNYANKDGFEIVSKEDYEKYQQGYCLAENRILDKKELYERAVGEYLEKDLEIIKGIRKELRLKHDYRKINIDRIYNFDYYVSDIFNSSNWYEYLTENFDENKTYIEISNARKTNPMYHFFVDLENDIAGFKKPIIFDNVVINLYLDNAFQFKNNSFSYLNIDFANGKKVTERDKERYEYFLQRRKENQKNITSYRTKFDNCGNTNIDVKAIIKSGVTAVLKGG